MLDSNRSEKLFYVGVVTAIVLELYLSSLYSYILFHSLIEIVTITIAFALFILTWNTHQYMKSSYLRLLGIGYAFIAIIDLIHTLAYKGMGVFPTFGSNQPTQLWIAARYLQAITLLVAPFLVERKIDNRAIIGTYALAVSALVALVFSGNFPDCYIEGQGLTPFKISSEYLISAFLLVSLYLFYRKRKYFDDRVFFLIAASIICTILSEISFTAYVSVYGFANLVGHFAKLVAFYLIYQAILVTGLKEPFDLIFRDLKQAEEALLKSQNTLEEKVRERTAELRASEERYRSLIQKVQTAIVLHDDQGRILTSNPLAQRLLGLSEDQLLGKTLIDPAWHFLREDGSVMPIPEYPVSRVLSTRQPLRDYVTGISRPDRDAVTWALVNAEPEYNEAGAIERIIVSFVDITERKQAERNLALMNFALNNVDEAAFLIDENARFRYVNNDACHILGYTRTELLGLSVSDVDPDFPPERWLNHWNDLKTQHSLTFEGRHRNKEGRIFPVEISANYFEYDGQGYNLALARDITERKRIEQVVRDSEEKFSAAFRNSPNSIAITHFPDGEILDINEGYLKMFGYSRIESVGKTTTGLALWADKTDRETFFAKLVESGHVTDFETQLRRKDGSLFTAMMGAQFIKLRGETCILSVAYDITERKRAEEALHRLNRELRAISNCNQVLVRAEDEQTLLSDICRIICDEAGYRLTWVGYAEHDDAKTVRPAAWAGSEDGYLANANITWADTEHGRGPSGTAIRSGESACIQDFTTDPQAAPWRENALQRGYRSSIALPLKDENAKTFGVLNIYSTEPKAFTPDEMRILEELAGDLAFGIVVLRARTERKRAEEALRESETKFRAVFENSVDAIGVSKVGIHTFVNPAYLALFGYG